MGRNSVKDKNAASRTEQTNNYLRGVDYFLNNEKEQAMDRFIACLNSSDPTFESNIALGNIFRKHGEVDRAISIHSKLVTSEELEPDERELANIELANDFLSAGLLDRAEDILLVLIEIPRQRKKAALLLIKLYEQERDFSKAIAVGLENKDILSKSGLNSLSHFYCELAQQQLFSGNFKECEAYLSEALEFNQDSTRARLIKCELLIKCQDRKWQEKVVALCIEVATLDQTMGISCLQVLQKTFSNKYDSKYRSALEQLEQITQSASIMAELCLVIEKSSREDAESLILKFLQDRPNLKLFSSLMALRSKDNLNPETSQVLMQLKSIVDAQLASSVHYSCSRCGFESSMMFWQCPSCRRWDTMHAKHTIDGD